MILGRTIFKMDGNPYYTPEFPRGGLSAAFALQVMQTAGSPNVTVMVQHKDYDETAWSDAGTIGTTITGAGYIQEPAISHLKELLRVKFNFAAGDSADASIHFFLSAPSWRPYA